MIVQVWLDKLAIEVIAPLKLRWQALSQRDRTALLALTISIAIVISYLTIWQPIQHSLKNNKLLYQNKHELLAWIKQQEPEIKKIQASLNKRPKLKSEQSVLAIVSNAAKKQTIVFKRYEPDNNNGIRIWLEQQPFNNIILWLDHIAREYGMQVVNINLDKQAPGLVDAKIVLRY